MMYVPGLSRVKIETLQPSLLLHPWPILPIVPLQETTSLAG